MMCGKLTESQKKKPKKKNGIPTFSLFLQHIALQNLTEDLHNSMKHTHADGASYLLMQVMNQSTWHSGPAASLMPCRREELIKRMFYFIYF